MINNKSQNGSVAMMADSTGGINSVRRHWHSFAIKSVSPLFLAIANLSLAFIAILFPPQWFVVAANEPDVVFLNVKYMLLVIACTGAFVSGVVFYRLSRGRSSFVFRKSPIFQSSGRLIKKVQKLLWLGLGINIATLAILLHGVGPHRFLLSLTDKTIALAVRNEVLIVGRLAGINVLALQTFVFAVLVMAFFVLLNCKKSLSLTRFKMLFISVTITYLAVTVLTIARWPILQLFSSMLLIYILYLNTVSGMGFVRMLKLGILFIILALMIFLAIGALKYGFSHVLGSVVGYTVASYNLGAAVVSGIFRQPNSGSTFATFGFFWQFPILGNYFRQIGIDYGINLPIAGGANMTNVNIWSYVIAETTNLNPHWNWTTVYAYIYGDVGWGVLFVFLAYGAISQYLYERFVDLRFFFVLMYTFFFVYQITWFTSVFISNTMLDDYTAFALALTFYIGPSWRSSLLLRQRKSISHVSRSLIGQVNATDGESEFK